MSETQLLEKTLVITIKETPKTNLRRSTKAHCFICQKQVKLMTFSETAELFNTDIKTIYGLTQKTDLHLLHNRKGEVMVCGNAGDEIINEHQMRLSNPRIIIVKPLC